MRKLFVIISLILTVGLVSAQNMTQSPFSRYAYGLLDDNVPNTYRSMGGVGVGMRSNKVICSAQPASFTACDSMTFMFDVAASVGWNRYQDYAGRRNKGTGNLEYLSLQFPIWRQHIAMAAGVMPYSSVGYEINQIDTTSLSDYDAIYSYLGEGGLSQVFVGLSFNICDWVALGANMYYMFGESTNFRTISFAQAGLSSASQVSYMKVNSFRFRYGLQVFHTFGDHRFVLGAIFENKQKLKSTYNVLETSLLDTITTYPNDQHPNPFEMPMIYGGGVSYSWANRLTVAFDYTRDCMSKARYFDQVGSLNDRNRYAIGVEYRHNPTGQRYVDHVMWRVGCNITDNYAPQLANVKKVTTSLGVGLPLRNVGTVFNASLEYTHNGTKSFLEENSLRLTINAAISENWFFKRRL